MHATDIFLSHASQDKDEYALPLVAALRHRSVSVWVDEAQILPGQSLITTIGRGIDKARFVVLLITDTFLGRNWTEAELNTALSKEIDSGEQNVIVVLAADRDIVFKRYPLLRHKLALPWSAGADALADNLARRFGRRPAEYHWLLHEKLYKGSIWTRVQAQAKHVGTEHEVTLLWGPYRFSEVLVPLTTDPVSLTHQKIKDNAVPLYALVRPACIVTIGQGPPLDPDYHSIDEGWTRIQGAPIEPYGEEESY